MIQPTESPKPHGLLFSGGLDSSLLAVELFAANFDVQPIYVRFGLVWEDSELAAARRFWTQAPHRREIVVLEEIAILPSDHWSRTGREIPGCDSSDESVDLPGRNEQMLRAAARWCHRAGISQLAMGTLGTSPFPDATPRFLRNLERELARNGIRVRLSSPFSALDKSAVMQQGAPADRVFGLRSNSVLPKPPRVPPLRSLQQMRRASFKLPPARPA